MLKNKLCYCEICRFKDWQIEILKILINRSTDWLNQSPELASSCWSTDWFVLSVDWLVKTSRPVGLWLWSIGWLGSRVLSGLLRLISLSYVQDWLGETVRLYIYVLVSKLRVFNLLLYFASSYFLVFFISIIDSIDIPSNDLQWSLVLYLFVFCFCFLNEWGWYLICM